MVRRRGPRLTSAQKAELWRRWRQGESLNAIGRALGRIPKMVRYVVAGAGGMPPPPRQRSRWSSGARAAKSKGLTRDDAYMLAGAAMDLIMTQLVDGTQGIHAMMPKGIFRK